MGRLSTPLTRWPVQTIEWSATGLVLILVARPDNHSRQAARRFARQVLSEILSKLLSVSMEQLALVEEAYGPQLADHRNIRVSLSYSGNWILIGIGKEQALGVDIVCVEHLPEMESLCLYYLPEMSCRTVAGVPKPLRDVTFSAEWAKMEAGCKCLGLPLSEISATRSLALQSCQMVESEQVAGYEIGVATASSSLMISQALAVPPHFLA
jgi:4'-phosphopantetheinyl transferase